MKILVCVKQVLDPRGMTVNRKAEKVFINREEYILDPASKAALEAASHLKQGGAEVIAISRRDRSASKMRCARRWRAEPIGRSGSDRRAAMRWSLRISSRRRCASSATIDLIIAGHQSLDTRRGRTGAALG